MKERIETYFRLKENGSDIKTEFIAGTTTFMAMAYIIFVNPAILSSPAGAGMDFEAVVAATCIASAVSTLIMGLVANYPIALAPGMGLNAFFSFTVCRAMGIPWQTALGMVFLSGILSVILSASRIRESIITCIPDSLKLASSAGIGLFIAFIGLKNAGLVHADPNTLVTLGSLGSPPVLLATAGIIITAVMFARKIRGSIFWGIIITGLLGIATGIVRLKGFIGTADIRPTIFQLDIAGALNPAYAGAILIFLFFDLFDTLGTFAGIGEMGGFFKDGKMPRATKALLSDSSGTVIGAVLGTSTVTSYIESSSGIAEGGRTGLANVFTAFYFIAALFFIPLAGMFGSGYQISDTVFLYPVTAPALIIVGSFMMGNVTRINWKETTESLPSFFTIILMPLTFSIAHGLAAGFILHTFMKLIAGKSNELNWLVYIISGLLILRYVFL